MSETPSLRVPGHALQHEGKPFNWGEYYQGWVRVYGGPNGVGLCECGETSSLLGSDAARKRWHREHKRAVSDA